MGKVFKFITHELREALPATFLFLFLFHMIALTKDVALEEYSLDALRATSATIAALIVAKAILIVEALPFARLEGSKLAWRVLWKTVLFTLVTLVIRLLEELIDLARAHGGLRAALDAFAGGVHWPMFAVTMAWLIGGLLLYALLNELAPARDK